MQQLKNYITFKSKHNFIFSKYLNEISKYNVSTLEMLHEEKSKRFIRIVNRVYRKSKFYKTIINEAGINIADIKSIDDISKLPIIDKQIIRNEIRSLLVKKNILIQKGYTSGTSGSPLVVYRDYKSILFENAYLWNFRKKHGLNIGDPIVSLRGVLDKTIIKRFNKSENILYLSSYNITDKYIDTYAKEISTFRPKAFWGYPSALFILAIELEKRNLKFIVPLTFTSSETLYEFQREKIQEVFNTRIFDWYGNAERTIALEQCEYGNYHEPPLYSINEYNDDSLVTTSLINESFPLIRYRVDDSVIKTEDKCCKCNNPGPVINKIIGRNDDFVILQDGTLIGRLDVAFKGINNVLYSQIIQHSFEQLEVNIVPSPIYKPSDGVLLVSNIKKRVGDEIIIKLNLVSESEIMRSSAGKYKLVINKLLKSIGN